jgi:hypothetical protein
LISDTATGGSRRTPCGGAESSHGGPSGEPAGVRALFDFLIGNPSRRVIGKRRRINRTTAMCPRT